MWYRVVLGALRDDLHVVHRDHNLIGSQFRRRVSTSSRARAACDSQDPNLRVCVGAPTADRNVGAPTADRKATTRWRPLGPKRMLCYVEEAVRLHVAERSTAVRNPITDLGLHAASEDGVPGDNTDRRRVARLLVEYAANMFTFEWCSASSVARHQKALSSA